MALFGERIEVVAALWTDAEAQTLDFNSVPAAGAPDQPAEYVGPSKERPEDTGQYDHNADPIQVRMNFPQERRCTQERGDHDRGEQKQVQPNSLVEVSLVRSDGAFGDARRGNTGSSDVRHGWARAVTTPLTGNAALAARVKNDTRPKRGGRV